MNLDKLFAAIVADYAKDNEKSLYAGNAYTQNRLEGMKSGNLLSAEFGKKYIRIVCDGSAWGFVVNCHDDAKFKYGDILMAAGWKTPAKNQARGNVIAEDFSKVKWCGPKYLR